jgi:hypothetical protein
MNSSSSKSLPVYSSLVRSASVSGLPVRMSFTPALRISSLVKVALVDAALRLTISQAAR